MRTISAADDALFTAVGGRSTFVRVDVQDGGLTYRDLTAYLGQNFLVSVKFNDSVDNEGISGEVFVKREVEQLSVAPLMQGSPANLAFAYPGSYSPLIFIGRGLRIYTADLPDGQTPVSSDWRFMHEGSIDTVDSAAGELLKVTFSDHQADLRDTYIERERVYSFAQGASATKGCRVWQSLVTFAQNELVIPSDSLRNGHFYKDNTAGSNSTAAAEPVWPTGAASTVVDSGITWLESGATSNTTGTAVETIMAQIIADNGAAVTVNVPGGSPGWLIKWFLQQRQSVWDGIRALADQIGWDLRYQWDSGSNTFKLNLYTPNRSKVTPDRTFGANEKWDVQGLEIDRSKIRNAIEVIVSASGSQDPSGNPLRASVLVTDPTSITKYGRRYMLMGEASSSNVDTTAEATVMANAALSDLKEPNAEKKVVLPYFPFVELGDLYRFSPDAVYSDQNLDLAVVAYEHNFSENGETTTTLTCRGKPSTGCDRWLAKDTRVQFDDVHQLTLVDSDTPTITAKDVVGGTLLTVSTVQNKGSWGQDWEWHIGTSSGFTPDNTTVIQSQGGNQVVVPHLIPGKGYWAKIVPMRRNAGRIVRGSPSVGFAFTAARGNAGHLYSDPDITTLPLNGGFESNSDANGPPDHWNVGAGVWGTDLSLGSGAGAKSGLKYLVFADRNALGPVLTSDPFMVRPAALYRMDLLMRDHTTGHAQCKVTVQWLDQNKATLGTSFNIVGNGIILWATGQAVGLADGNARWAQVRIEQSNPADANGFDVDRIQVRELRPSGFLSFGNGTLPVATVTHFLQPGIVQNATDANERKMPMFDAFNGGIVLGGCYYNARIAHTNLTYVFTVRVNGVNSTITFTANTGVASGSDSGHQIIVQNGDLISVQVGSTAAGGPVAATDGIFTIPIYT